MALDNKTSLLNTPSPRQFLGPRTREYNPYNYTDSISAYDKGALREAVFDDDVEQVRDGEAHFSSSSKTQVIIITKCVSPKRNFLNVF